MRSRFSYKPRFETVAQGKMQLGNGIFYPLHPPTSSRRHQTTIYFGEVNARRSSGDKALSECRNGELTGERDTFRRTRLYAFTWREKVVVVVGGK